MRNGPADAPWQSTTNSPVFVPSNGENHSVLLHYPRVFDGASPDRVITLLLETALRDLRQARRSAESDQELASYQQTHRPLFRAGRPFRPGFAGAMHSPLHLDDM